MSIEVNTRQYECAHGKAPRGRGYWAFFFDRQTDIHQAVFYSGTYREALKMAKLYAVSEGHHRITVGS